MTVYNDEIYVKKALESVIGQYYQNWELIIIDDASYDNTKKIIETYVIKDKRIKYYKNNKNQDRVYSSNEGIKLAHGEYIARIDSDDVWIDKNKLKTQVGFLKKNPDYGFVGTWAKKIDSKDKVIGKINYPEKDDQIRNYILIENCFIHSSILARKNLILKAGKYSTEFRYAEDYALWLKFGTFSKFYNTPQYMVGYRINERGITKTRYNMQIKDSIKAIKRFKDDYKNFYKGYILWNLRGIIPQSIKNFSSKLLMRMLT